jgi:hypothetical protein
MDLNSIAQVAGWLVLYALSGTAYGDEVLKWTLGEMPDGTSVTISCALTTNETPPTSYTVATNGAQCPVIAKT